MPYMVIAVFIISALLSLLHGPFALPGYIIFRNHNMDKRFLSTVIFMAILQCPAFFRNVKNLYGYVYDGRINRIGRRLFELHPEENGLTKVMMYMNFEDYDHYQNCENTYKGYMEHFDAVTNITLQNRDVEMETAYIQILAPTLNAETKWALFTGLSTRPIMPIARKLLLSKNRLCENKELENQLKVSKEDIKQLKLYHMYTVT